MAPWPLVSEIVRQPCCQAHRAGWPCHPVLVTLGLAHDQHLSIIKIHVLDAQSQTLHELGKMGVGVHEAKNLHTTTVSSPLPLVRGFWTFFGRLVARFYPVG